MISIHIYPSVHYSLDTKAEIAPVCCCVLHVGDPLPQIHMLKAPVLMGCYWRHVEIKQ